MNKNEIGKLILIGICYYNRNNEYFLASKDC